MSKYRPLNSGDVLPASFIAALQEYISTHAANLLIEPSGTPPTSITAQASAGSGQVALGVNGLWRYAATTVVAAHPGGAAGTYDILAVASANSFGSPDTDATDYAFGLQIVPAGGSSSGTLNGNAIVAERKVGTVLWDGSQIAAITQTVGSQSSSRTQFITSPNPAITPQRVRGAASQSVPLAVWETSAGTQRAALGADGIYSALGYQVGGTPLAAAHLSNGVTGSGAIALASSPALAGTPTAPTPAVDTNTTQLATTAFVTGQLSASGDGTPAMDGAAARGTSVHGARADHVHPIDTSRAAVASPALTGTPTVPTAAVDTNTTQAATTAFVLGQLSAAGDGTPTMNGAAARGTSLHGARADHVHPTDTSRAATVSPSLTGTPTGPTAAVDTNTAQLATTAFVLGQLSAAPDGTPAMNGAASRGTSLHGARADHVHPPDTSRAALDSPTFTTKITTPLAELTGASPVLAFTGDVNGAKWLTKLGGTTLTFLSDNAATDNLGNGDISYGGRTYRPKVYFDPSGNIVAAGTFSGGSLLVSTIIGTPGFTGAVTGQTAAAGDNTTKLATTAFVLANGTQLGSSTPLMDAAAAVGTAAAAAHADHRHPTDTSRASTNAPTFTGGVTVSSGDLYVSPGSLTVGGTAVVAGTLTGHGNIVAEGELFARGNLVRMTDGSFSRGQLMFGNDGSNYLTSRAANSMEMGSPVGGVRIYFDPADTQLSGGTGKLGLYSAGGEQLRVSDLGVCLQPGVAPYLRTRVWSTSSGPTVRSVTGGTFDVLNTLIKDLKDLGILG